MSEGAPLRAATVASMAAEQQAREVEQLRARLAEQQPHEVEQLEQRLAAVIAPAAVKELGSDASLEQRGGSVGHATEPFFGEDAEPFGEVAEPFGEVAEVGGSDFTEDAPLPATASVAQQQQEWAVRVGNALLGQLSSPADPVPEHELHWQ